LCEIARNRAKARRTAQKLVKPSKRRNRAKNPQLVTIGDER
jgi:hypothetical protein